MSLEALAFLDTKSVTMPDAVTRKVESAKGTSPVLRLIGELPALARAEYGR